MNILFADVTTSEYPGVVQNTAQKWSEIFVSSFQSAFGQIVSVLPNLLAMIAILLVGYLIARIIGRIAAAISPKRALHHGLTFLLVADVRIPYRWIQYLGLGRHLQRHGYDHRLYS